jgi:hypothetical protein
VLAVFETQVDGKVVRSPDHPEVLTPGLPTEFKRVYKIEMSEANVGRPMRKIGHIDLLNIADPRGLARKPLTNGVLAFPFFTIENVEVVDGRHIVVGNDNNLPFSSSREPNRADDNELVLLEVEALLKAR